MQKTLPDPTPNERLRTETAPEQSAYTVLVGLVQHLDIQILSSQLFHIAVLSSIAPLVAYFALKQAAWYILVALCLLALALAIHWAWASTKLALQKLCWVGELLVLEEVLFPAGHGPFTRQKIFFDQLADQDVSWIDQLFMREIGTKHFRLIPALMLLIALLGAMVIIFTAFWPPL